MAGAWVESDNVSAVNLNEKGKENAINAVYPVGSIYINASNGTNPATLLGFGTWERFGEGRVLVSQDSTDADFDTAGETGGEKEHQLTEAEMPAHSHPYTDTYIYGSSGSKYDLVSGSYYGIQTYNKTTNSIGGDQPHNNLQPYITVYMWVRTA